MRHQYLCWPGLPDEWRRRMGDWRVRFRHETATRTVEVLRILPRGEAYG
jgi:mRNA-degrading endonuclease RelE of RelBE toxin-antitoxin system